MQSCADQILPCNSTTLLGSMEQDIGLTSTGRRQASVFATYPIEVDVRKTKDGIHLDSA